MHQVVESLAVLEEIVNSTEDTEDTEREDPDPDNGDNGGPTANEESEQTEECGNGIDNQDGTSELPRRNGRPERSIRTSDEDEPVLRQRDLEEDDFIKLSEVLNDTTIFAMGNSVENDN